MPSDRPRQFWAANCNGTKGGVCWSPQGAHTLDGRVPVLKEKMVHLCNFCSESVDGCTHITLTVPGESHKVHFEHYHCRFPGDCWHQQQRKEQLERPKLIVAA